MLGFARLEPEDSGPEGRIGYLVNMLPTVMVGPDDTVERSALDMYFLQQDGNTFKATVKHEPYFYVGVKPGSLKVRASFPAVLSAPRCSPCCSCLLLLDMNSSVATGALIRL